MGIVAIVLEGDLAQQISALFLLVLPIWKRWIMNHRFVLRFK